MVMAGIPQSFLERRPLSLRFFGNRKRKDFSLQQAYTSVSIRAGV